MKTQKILFTLVALIQISTGLRANGNEIEKSTSSFSMDYQGVPVQIQIQFHVENDFSITVEGISCTNEWLKQHVQKELASVKLLTDKEKIGESFSISMIFQ